MDSARALKVSRQCMEAILLLGLVIAASDGIDAAKIATSNYDYQPTPITSESGFVVTNGTKFSLDSKPFYFVGTNAWYLGQPNVMTDVEVADFFKLAGIFGMKVVRYFGYSNGCGLGVKTADPVQPQLGLWNEKALRRIDLILAEAGLNGIRILLSLSNFEPFLGGWQWWVDQVLGEGYALEMFLVDDRVKCAFQNFISMLLNRKNVYTGMTYRDDPTIFALELANEPHTNILYESQHGLTPGRMALGWLGEMAAFVRGPVTQVWDVLSISCAQINKALSIDKKHMLTTGEEGYRADGSTECCMGLQWMNGGFKGSDFSRNAALENISFSTVHIYPDNWKIPASDFRWIIPNFLEDRANISHAQGKPIILEEFGMKTGYLSSRDIILEGLGGAAVESGYGGMMVWQMYFTALNYQGPEDYNFRSGESGTTAMKALVDWSWQPDGWK